MSERSVSGVECRSAAIRYGLLSPDVCRIITRPEDKNLIACSAENLQHWLVCGAEKTQETCKWICVRWSTEKYFSVTIVVIINQINRNGVCFSELHTNVTQDTFHRCCLLLAWKYECPVAFKREPRERDHTEL